MRSSSQGTGHVCDCSFLTTANYKVLPGRPHGGNCPPHIRLPAQPRHYNFLGALQSRSKVLFGLAVFIHITAFLTQAAPFKGFLTGASVEILSSTSTRWCYWDALAEAFFPTLDSLLFDSQPFRLSFPQFSGQEKGRSLYSGLLSSEMIPPICAAYRMTPVWCHSLGK